MEPSLTELARRVETLEHVNAIKELKARYWTAMDRQKLDEARDCFVATGAVVDFEGVPLCNDRDAFIEVVRAQGCRPGLYNMHHGQNPRIKITGPAEAEGLWDVNFRSIDAVSRITIQMSGDYVDRYVLENGRWLIQKTQFRQTSFLMQKIDEKGAPTVVTLGEANLHAFGN
jgi:hypothetical protein